MVLEIQGVRNSLFKHSRDYDQGIGVQIVKPNVGTREIFIYASDPGPTPGQYAYYLCWEVGPDGGEGNISFKCPHDFSSLEKAEIIYFPDITHSASDIDINVSLSKVGEDADGRDETNSTTHSGTIKKCTAIDVTDYLANMKVDDYVGIHIVNNDQAEAGMTMKLLGLCLRYV